MEGVETIEGLRRYPASAFPWSSDKMMTTFGFDLDELEVTFPVDRKTTEIKIINPEYFLKKWFIGIAIQFN